MHCQCQSLLPSKPEYWRGRCCRITQHGAAAFIIWPSHLDIIPYLSSSSSYYIFNLIDLFPFPRPSLYTSTNCLLRSTLNRISNLNNTQPWATGTTKDTHLKVVTLSTEATEDRQNTTTADHSTTTTVVNHTDLPTKAASTTANSHRSAVTTTSNLNMANHSTISHSTANHNTVTTSTRPNPHNTTAAATTHPTTNSRNKAPTINPRRLTIPTIHTATPQPAPPVQKAKKASAASWVLSPAV